MKYAEVSNKDKTGTSCREVFCEKGVLKNFEQFSGKNHCWSPFLERHRCFSVNLEHLFCRTLANVCFCV